MFRIVQTYFPCLHIFIQKQYSLLLLQKKKISDRPNPISAKPNRTIFLPNYSSADRTMFGQNGRTCSVNVPYFCRTFGSAEPSVRLLPNVFGVRSITNLYHSTKYFKLSSTVQRSSTWMTGWLLDDMVNNIVTKYFVLLILPVLCSNPGVTRSQESWLVSDIVLHIFVIYCVLERHPPNLAEKQ